MVFKTNPGFRFHDSRGFEAGGVLELDKVNAFIAERSQQTNLERRLHAIWYVQRRRQFQFNILLAGTVSL
jgi:hypothetical protein